MPNTLTAYTHGCVEAPQVPGMCSQCVCMRGTGRDATEGGLNTHFCERFPWCGVDPHPWPSPPWLWQRADPPHISSGAGIRPVHQLAHRGRQVQSHTVHRAKHFSHRLHLSLLACVTRSHFWPLFIFSLCIWERSFPNQSEPQDGRAAAVFPTSKHRTALMIRHCGSCRVPPVCNLTSDPTCDFQLFQC